LNAGELRSLMGLFSVQSLQEVSDALAEGNSQRMLDIVQELERNGRSLQHFCRELARYFRNLLVARICGSETKLIAASAAEQARMRETAAKFSEEDLTRYLHLSLELFKTYRLRCSRGSIWKSGCCALSMPESSSQSSRLWLLSKAAKLPSVRRRLRNRPGSREAGPLRSPWTRPERHRQRRLQLQRQLRSRSHRRQQLQPPCASRRKRPEI
jgi:DNA polymerase III gamma/tau subunit